MPQVRAVRRWLPRTPAESAFLTVAAMLGWLAAYTSPEDPLWQAQRWVERVWRVW